MTRETISNRHRGDLGGRFEDSRLPAKVTVTLGAEFAHYPVVQHLSWMLLNLLARQTHEIREIELVLPEGIAPVKRLSPLVSADTDLLATLREGIFRINPDVLTSKTDMKTQISVRIGPGPLGETDFALATTAYGWSGYVGHDVTDILGEEDHPIGAYIAASLCAGEIFKFIRGMHSDAGTFAQRIWLDAASLHVSSEAPFWQGPALPLELRLRSAVIAGIGAVGSSMLHTLYPLIHAQGELTFVDGDPKGLDETNLNRYVLFGREHVSEPKASMASKMFTGSQLITYPIDESWQTWYSKGVSTELDLVISAVDKNSARHAIQAAMPRLILGASTNEMRAQVNLYDVVRGGPCLRCRNQIEETIPDDVVIARLRTLTVDERVIEAQRVGVVPTDLEAFLLNPQAHCGMIGGQTLQKFASENGQEEWSVGFVSLLAGVLLAAEYLKMSIGQTQVALDALHNTFRFQFWHPENTDVNTIVGTPPEAECFCQTSIFRRLIGLPTLF